MGTLKLDLRDRANGGTNNDMNNKPFLLSRIGMKRSAIATAVGLCLIGGGFAIAQQQPLEPVQWDKRRLDQLDRNVRPGSRCWSRRTPRSWPCKVRFRSWSAVWVIWKRPSAV